MLKMPRKNVTHDEDDEDVAMVDWLLTVQDSCERSAKRITVSNTEFAEDAELTVT